MIETPSIERVEAQDAAVIHLVVPRGDMPKVMGPAIGELVAAVREQGNTVVGPVFAHHLRMDRTTFDFEVGVPVASPFRSSGRVAAGSLPAATVARTVYVGGYEGLPAAWSEFTDWMTREGHVTRGDLWEVYVAGPESGPDPTRWRTELNRPLVEAEGAP